MVGNFLLERLLALKYQLRGVANKISFTGVASGRRGRSNTTEVI
jgi:hypothetical protein